MTQKACTNHENHLCRLYEAGLPQNEPERYALLVRNPKYVCKNCGRVAAGKENLCAAILLGTWEE